MGTNNIPTLTSLSATSTRVGTAISAVYDIHREHKSNQLNNNTADIIPTTNNSEQTGLLSSVSGVLSSKINVNETNEIVLKLDNISYFAPNSDHLLLHEVNLMINRNESLLIVGFSGCGKSSLLRVIAGLWNDGYGEVTRPKLKHCLFLPQKPYIPNLPLEFNTLRNQILFPKYLNDKTMINNITATHFHDDLVDDDIQSDGTEMTASCIDDKQILDVLEKINLTHLDTYSSGHSDSKSLIYCKADWCNCLSVGEQQRLAIGRCLISEPKMIFVDEATSALDSVNGSTMYRQLKDMKVPLISIGHHQQLAKYHDFVLEFQKDGKWELLDSKQFLSK